MLGKEKNTIRVLNETNLLKGVFKRVEINVSSEPITCSEDRLSSVMRENRLEQCDIFLTQYRTNLVRDTLC